LSRVELPQAVFRHEDVDEFLALRGQEHAPLGAEAVGSDPQALAPAVVVGALERDEPEAVDADEAVQDRVVGSGGRRLADDVVGVTASVVLLHAGGERRATTSRERGATSWRGRTSQARSTVRAPAETPVRVRSRRTESPLEQPVARARPREICRSSSFMSGGAARVWIAAATGSTREGQLEKVSFASSPDALARDCLEAAQVYIAALQREGPALGKERITSHESPLFHPPRRGLLERVELLQRVEASRGVGASSRRRPGVYRRLFCKLRAGGKIRTRIVRRKGSGRRT